MLKTFVEYEFARRLIEGLLDNDDIWPIELHMVLKWEEISRGSAALRGHTLEHMTKYFVRSHLGMSENTPRIRRSKKLYAMFDGLNYHMAIHEKVLIKLRYPYWIF